MLMVLYRVITMPLLIVAFLLTSLSGRLVFWSAVGRRLFHLRTTSFFSSLALRVLRISVTISGNGAASVPDAALFVSNHLSYLDILVMAAHFPSLFITSMEVKHTPFLGLMADMGGSLFIERRNRDNIEHEIDTITTALRQGFHVALYPEGTSSDGRTVLPFKRSLIQSAINAGAPVQPVVLAYRSINGQPFGDDNRDRVCWYGRMSFLPHFLGLFRISHVRAELNLLPPVFPSSGNTRKDICNLVQPAIHHAYTQMTGTGSSVEDHRHALLSRFHVG